MPLWKIAWRSIQRRYLASVLTMFSMALGVMLVVAVLLVVGIVDESFKSNSSLGYDTIVGAKGGQLQLTLNTVYYLSQPVENLPYAFYQEFLRAEQRDAIETTAKPGEDFKPEIEFQIGEKWDSSTSSQNQFVIPAKQQTMSLRVPILKRNPTPKEFTLRLSVTSEENVSNKSIEAAYRITSAQNPVQEDSAQVDSAQEVTQDPVLNTPAAPQKRTSISLKASPTTSDQNQGYAEFTVALENPVQTPVSFIATLIGGRDGEYCEYLSESPNAAVPVCLGDYFGQFRVVGTTANFFDLIYDQRRKRTYQFAEGANFTGRGKHGVFEAILGAKVARENGLKVGELIQPAHGAPEGKAHDEFEVVGILASTGTPQDRAVFVNLQGFNSIAEHLRADGMKEVTSLLVDTRDPFRSMQLETLLSEGPVGQGVKPVRIIYGLFSQIVGPIRNLLLVITALICVVSGISILVSIYNSMSDRKHEIAIMRSLGAGRGTVMTVVLLESVMISLFGGLFGWLAGHALIGLASGKIEDQTGVVVSAFDFAPPMQEMALLLGPTLGGRVPVELWLVPGIILLAIIVGFLPALSAYGTDVAKALQSNP